jgi:nitroalkane oxidase
VQLIQNINVAKMIDFTLTSEQTAIRSFIRSFANTHLKHARSLYDPPTPHAKWSRFQSTQSIYRAAVEAGLIKAQIPAALGGTGGSLNDAAIVVEELYSVETSASLTILGTGLGLTPLIMAGSLEQHKKFLARFLSCEGTPLGSLVFSEPAGSANFAEAGGAGFSTTARENGDDYVINGEKVRLLTSPAFSPH